MADATMPAGARTRHCKILVVSGAFSLDVFGPLEVFTMAARLWSQRSHWDPALGAAETSELVDATDASLLVGQPGAYEVELVSEHGGPVPSTSHVSLNTSRATHQIVDPFDTLVVAGGNGLGISAGPRTRWSSCCAWRARRQLTLRDDQNPTSSKRRARMAGLGRFARACMLMYGVKGSHITQARLKVDAGLGAGAFSRLARGAGGDASWDSVTVSAVALRARVPEADVVAPELRREVQHPDRLSDAQEHAVDPGQIGQCVLASDFGGTVQRAEISHALANGADSRVTLSVDYHLK